jgi:hypothetical protein
MRVSANRLRIRARGATLGRIANEGRKRPAAPIAPSRPYFGRRHPSSWVCPSRLVAKLAHHTSAYIGHSATYRNAIRPLGPAFSLSRKSCRFVFSPSKSTEQALMAKDPLSPPLQQTGTPVEYVDQLDVCETFADSIHSVLFDGQSLRIEFCITRVGEAPSSSRGGKRYPACRLVLSPGAAVDLINRMQQVGAALTKAGELKANPTQ